MVTSPESEYAVLVYIQVMRRRLESGRYYYTYFMLGSPYMLSESECGMISMETPIAVVYRREGREDEVVIWRVDTEGKVWD